MENNIIKAARIRKNLTQEELGKRIGVTKSAVMKYEKGIVENIKRSTIIKLSRALDLSPLDILNIHPEHVPNTDRERALLDDFRKLNPEGQAIAAATVRSLAACPYYTKKTETISA